MKNRFRIFFANVLEILLIVGCSSQIQPTPTASAIPRQTNTSLSAALPTPLPTFTPFSSIPSTPLSPFPKGIFSPFQDSIYDPSPYQTSPDIVKTIFGVISEGTTEEKILTDLTMGDVMFSIFWEEGTLDIVLIQPDGKEVETSNINYRSFITADSFRKRYYIFAQHPGTWIMRISRKAPANQSNYMIQVTSSAPATLHYVINPNDPSSARDGIEYKFVPLQRSEHFSGNPIAFNFGITDNVNMLAGRQYIHGVSMNITIEDPAKTQYSLELYDDGIHKDGKAGDGVYANTFTNTFIVGTYNIFLQISGKNNRAKEPFTREYFFSIEVK